MNVSGCRKNLFNMARTVGSLLYSAWNRFRGWEIYKGKRNIMRNSRIHGTGTTTTDVDESNTSGGRGYRFTVIKAGRKRIPTALRHEKKIYNKVWPRSKMCIEGAADNFGWQVFILPGPNIKSRRYRAGNDNTEITRQRFLLHKANKRKMVGNICLVHNIDGGFFGSNF